MRLGHFPQLRRLALALALVGLVTLIWVLWSSTAGLLAAAIVGFVVLVAICLWVLPARLVAHDTTAAELEPEQRATAVNSARTTLVQGLVGVAALAGILVAWQQLQTDREQSRTDRQQLRDQITLTRQGQVAERFTRAVDQLGSDKLEQRLGGVYGLERIAKDSPDTDMRLVVTEVLTAYVRQHASGNPGGPPEFGAVELSVRAPDVQAVMTVLGRRTAVATDPPLNLAYADLRGANLRGAQLQRAYLYHARLDKARLDGAQLQNANLYNAELEEAIFQDALLQDANLGSAQAQGTIFTRAQLQGADLSGIELQHADVSSAKLQGADLRGAQLQEAFLIGVQLQDADLASAQLQGANLQGAQLQKAELREAQLRGADLTRAQLQEARCDAKTVWPRGFDWKAAGAHLVTPTP